MMSLAGAGMGQANTLPVGLRARLGGLLEAGLGIAELVEGVALLEGTDFATSDDDRPPAAKDEAEKVDVAPLAPALA